MTSPATVIANNRFHLSALIGGAIASQGFQCNLNHIDVSGIEDFAALFTKWPQFNGDISQWNTSSAVSMNSMFKGCEFNGDISKWNTSKVIDMDRMFKGAKFNGSILGWDVSKVECMEGMFKGSDFNGDISKWNMGNVQILASMFANSQFNNDISAWNVSKVVDMTHMFEGTTFNQDISQWDVSLVHRMDSMFYSSPFNQDISQWNVGKVWDFSNMFAYGAFVHDISEWTVGKAAKKPSFYKGNSLFLAAQSMEPWIIGLYLENAETPAIPEWKQAFSNIQPLALSLGLTLAEHVAAIVKAHSVIVQSANRAGEGETAIDNAVFETHSSAA